MEIAERQLAIDQLESSEATLLKLFDGLTSAQWHYRESAGRWSIAENLEHLILFEAFIRSAVQRILEAPAQPEKTLEAAAREPLVFGLADSREARFSAREVVCPTGNSPDPGGMIAEFQNTRSITIAFAAETQAALREHFFPHIAFGDLDCYQWLIVLGRHTLRHVRQIEQIKADPDYPRP